MTKHTPEFLRARSSNLSLRSAAMASTSNSNSSPLSTSAAVPPVTASSSSSGPPPPSVAAVAAAATASASASASVSLPPPLSSSSEPPRAATVPETIESKLFRLADLAARPPTTNKLCLQCAFRLREAQRACCQPTALLLPTAAECVMCALREARPDAFTSPFCHFLEECPTVFHAVAYFARKLDEARFTELPARADWTDRIVPGGKYFVTRNGSSLVAFSVGKSYKPGNGVAMIAGHIDALTARLKPVSSKPSKAGYVQLGVAPYAGGLNETWWDRDLGIGGRVVVRDEESGKVSTRLVKLGWPIAKIPTLAPHFGVSMMGSKNKETQVVPIIGLDAAGSSAPAEPLGPAGSFVAKQPPKLVKLVASELGIKSYSSIVDWELELYDWQPATVMGTDKELISAGRIDDKLCSWPALVALLHAEDRDDDSTIRLVSLFDDEEIGSLLRQGAKGNFLPLCIERAVEALCSSTSTSSSSSSSSSPAATFGPGVMGRTYASSFLVSADVTHAIHPNFLGSYLDDHAPRLNVGLTICADSNGHMTTDSVSTAFLTRVAELSGCQTQVFMIRNDSRSGGTVGPSLSSAMGVRCADAGLPQLSMHSIRATTGALDPGLGVKFFKGFFENYEKVDAEWQ